MQLIMSISIKGEINIINLKNGKIFVKLTNIFENYLIFI